MDVITDTFNIEEYVELPHCFTSRDVLDWHAGEQLRYTDIFNKLNDGHLFIKVIDGAWDIYISKMALYRWFVRLNTRLARGKQAKLETQKINTLLNELQPNSRRWNVVPHEYTIFGQELGLIYFLPNREEYIFPIAYLMSFLSQSNINAFAQHYIESFKQNISADSNQEILGKIKSVLDGLTTREASVIARRYGIFGNVKTTLEEIGKTFNLTRERIRQIEGKGLRRLRRPSHCNKLVIPFICFIHQSRGNLVLKNGELEKEILFIAKILNIPISQFPYTDKYILGLGTDELTIEKGSIDTDISAEAIAEIIKLQSDIPFTQTDLETIAAILREKPIRHITKSEKVYQILKQIGKPSHYSEITEMYNDVYPEDTSTERIIHAILTREEHGIVWIGIKGTYALKEWGFEHPSSTLFKTVKNIIEKKYQETRKPVSFLIVQAEIGKYRKAVNRNSLFIASYLNPEIKIVNKDKLVPSPVLQEKRSVKDVSAEELNRVLRNFELETKGGDGKMIEPMSFERALQIAKEALETYKQAKTKADMDEIFIKFGRNGIGYRPLCKMFYAQKPPEIAVKAYKKE